MHSLRNEKKNPSVALASVVLDVASPMDCCFFVKFGIVLYKSCRASVSLIKVDMLTVRVQMMMYLYFQSFVADLVEIWHR
jgi:hypothetical protein